MTRFRLNFGDSGDNRSLDGVLSQVEVLLHLGEKVLNILVVHLEEGDHDLELQALCFT